MRLVKIRVGFVNYLIDSSVVMITLFRLFVFTCFSMLLVSCTTPGEKQSESDLFIPGSSKYTAWKLDDLDEYEAINALILEVDELIMGNSFDAAEDKLERVLRIKPKYAPAWSRLSWLALEKNLPERSVQMAKRSNSLAEGNRQLQSLNWSFIRDASKALDNLDAYLR